jgi:hypothetical protein
VLEHVLELAALETQNGDKLLPSLLVKEPVEIALEVGHHQHGEGSFLGH